MSAGGSVMTTVTMTVGDHRITFEYATDAPEAARAYLEEVAAILQRDMEAELRRVLLFGDGSMDDEGHDQ